MRLELFKISEIAKICNEKNIPFHADAVQGVGKDLLMLKNGIDFYLFHLINSWPKGISACKERHFN